MIISLTTVVCFATYVGLYSYLCGAYLLAFQRHKENFWLSIRVPEMLVADVLVNIIIGVSTGLRQVLAESGYQMPCYIMNMVSCLGGTIFPYTHFYRTIKAIIVVRHQWRKKYMRYFHARAARVHIAVISSVGLVVWGLSTPFTCCNENCNIPNCFLFSSYYLLLPVASMIAASFLLLIWFINHYDVKDATGCVDELWQVTAVSFLLFLPYFGILVALDWRLVKGYEWERLATALILLAHALFLYFGVVAPAARYGYDPFTKNQTYGGPEDDLPGGLELGAGASTIQRMLRASTTVVPLPLGGGGGGGGGGSGVALRTMSSMSISGNDGEMEVEFDEMLCTPERREAYLAFCSRHMCYEHIMFIMDMEDLMRERTQTRDERDKRRARLLEIGERYFRFGSTYDLGLNYRISSAVLRQLTLFGRRKVVFVDEYHTYTQALVMIQRKIKKKMIGTVFTQFLTQAGGQAFITQASMTVSPFTMRGFARTGGIAAAGAGGEDRAPQQQSQQQQQHQPPQEEDLVLPFVTDTLTLDDDEEAAAQQRQQQQRQKKPPPPSSKEPELPTRQKIQWTGSGGIGIQQQPQQQQAPLQSPPQQQPPSPSPVSSPASVGSGGGSGGGHAQFSSVEYFERDEQLQDSGAAVSPNSRKKGVQFA